MRVRLSAVVPPLPCFGARGSGTFLSRATAALATLFFLTSMALAYFASQVEEPEGLMDRVELPVAPVPAAVEVRKDVPAVPGNASGAQTSDIPAVPPAAGEGSAPQAEAPEAGVPAVAPAPAPDSEVPVPASAAEASTSQDAGSN